MKLRARLLRLEQNMVDAGCPACRDRRGRIVSLTSRKLPDGTVIPVDDSPPPCDHCGQVAEQIIEIILADPVGEIVEPIRQEQPRK